MTLVAAFRCRQGGILLCADREENDGYARREVEKIYRVDGLPACEVFLAGTGPGNIIRLANEEIHLTLGTASANRVNVMAEHRRLIEQAVAAIYVRFGKVLKQEPMGMIIVVAPRAHGVPLLYHTDNAVLVPETYYAAYGSGKTVADYLSDRIYRPHQHGGLDKGLIGVMAAFILREAEQSSAGVGLGFDMVFIHEGDKSLHFIPPDAAKEIEAGVPSLADAIYSYWKDHATVPEWLTKK